MEILVGFSILWTFQVQNHNIHISGSEIYCYTSKLKDFIPVGKIEKIWKSVWVGWLRFKFSLREKISLGWLAGWLVGGQELLLINARPKGDSRYHLLPLCTYSAPTLWSTSICTLQCAVHLQQVEHLDMHTADCSAVCTRPVESMAASEMFCILSFPTVDLTDGPCSSSIIGINTWHNTRYSSIECCWKRSA